MNLKRFSLLNFTFQDHQRSLEKIRFISFAKVSKTGAHVSHVLRSYVSTNGPNGVKRGLFQGLCLQVATFVGVPTPAAIAATAVETVVQ